MNWYGQKTVTHSMFAKAALAIFLVLHDLLEPLHLLTKKWSLCSLPLILGGMVSALIEDGRSFTSLDFRGWALKGVWLYTCLS